MIQTIDTDINTIFNNWKEKYKDNKKYIIQLEKERQNIDDNIVLIDVDISNLEFSDITFKNEKIYTSKEWQTQYNKLINNNIILNSKDLLKYLKIPNGYCCFQRMGQTTKNFIKSGNAKWYNIKSLDDENNLDFVDKDTYIKECGEKSIKSLHINENDILISFKLTIGKTKLYLDSTPAFSNEAIDIITSKINYNSYYISLQLHKEYNKYTGRAIKGKTLNDDSKKLINIKIPETNDMFTSYQLQQIIAKFIEDETDNITNKTNHVKDEINKYKNELISSIFEKSNINDDKKQTTLENEQNIIFDNWKEKYKGDKYIIQLEKEKQNIKDDIVLVDVDINNLKFSDIRFIKIKLENISYQNFSKIDFLDKNFKDKYVYDCGLSGNNKGEFYNLMKYYDTGKTTSKRYLLKPNILLFSTIDTHKNWFSFLSEELYELKKDELIKNYKYNNNNILTCTTSKLPLNINLNISNKYLNYYLKNNLSKELPIPQKGIRQGISFKKENILQINILIPESNTLFTSYQLQQIIAKFIEDETDVLIGKFEQLDRELSKYKANLLYDIFN